MASAARVQAPEDEALPRARPVEKGPLHIPSLDGVRALSIAIVFFAHGGLGGILPAHFGLTLFFFLSGYLITTLLRVEFDQTNDISLRQFYLRRVLRIFPPFYLILGASILLTAFGAYEGSLTAKAITYQVLHFTNYYIIEHGWWHGLAPGSWVYWSLAIEEHFYLLFPLLYLWLRRHVASSNRQALLLLGLCALALVWRCILVFILEVPRDRVYLATDTRVDAILAGCILAVWRNPAFGKPQGGDRALMFVWLPLGFASVILSLVVRAPQFEQTLRYTLQSFGLFPFFIAAVRWHERSVFRLLNLRPVRYVGVLSYSLYLMHTTALWAVQNWTDWSTPAKTFVTLGVLLVIAAVIHHFIEKPCAALRRRLSVLVAPGA